MKIIRLLILIVVFATLNSCKDKKKVSIIGESDEYEIILDIGWDSSYFMNRYIVSNSNLQLRLVNESMRKDSIILNKKIKNTYSLDLKKFKKFEDYYVDSSGYYSNSYQKMELVFADTNRVIYLQSFEDKELSKIKRLINKNLPSDLNVYKLK